MRQTKQERKERKKKLQLVYISLRPQPLLEYYGVFVGCKDEGVMTLATLAAYAPLRAVKHSQIWKMCHHLKE